MAAADSPFSIPNIRLFLLFRILFNARFYYPVFSILFLDFGLTLSQFAILNAVWAVTIVICEVPSGALADTIGRRNLLVMAGGLMVLEISLWAFVPRDNLTLLFWVFVLNRVLSGVAEAAASGADEALAYDSLCQAGKSADWGRVLERQVQLQAGGFVIAMTLGGILYDPVMVQTLVALVRPGVEISGEQTLRLPIYLTLVTALFTLLTTLRMTEVSHEAVPGTGYLETIGRSFALVWSAGLWIFRTPVVIGIMLVGLLYDSVIRMLLTMASQYYRVIAIPESWFGLLGSALALFGFVVPILARRLVVRRSVLFNLVVTALVILAGLVGIAQVWPVWGIFPALILFACLNLTGYFLSYYLNRLTRSEHRATVLSFKGLFLNIGYGMIGLFYGVLLAYLRTGREESLAGVSSVMVKSRIFAESLPWFAWYFCAFGLILLLVFGRSLHIRMTQAEDRGGL